MLLVPCLVWNDWANSIGTCVWCETWINSFDWCNWMRLVVWHSLTRFMNMLIPYYHVRYELTQEVNVCHHWFCLIPMSLRCHKENESDQGICFFFYFSLIAEKPTKNILILTLDTFWAKKRKINIFLWNLSIKIQWEKSLLPFS